MGTGRGDSGNDKDTVTRFTLPLTEASPGVCIFPDESECDEWAFFRGERYGRWAAGEPDVVMHSHQLARRLYARPVVRAARLFASPFTGPSLTRR